LDDVFAKKDRKMGTAGKISNVMRFGVLVAAVVFVSATVSQASVLVDFLAEPVSPSSPEFIWDGAGLTSGPGSYGSGFAPPGGGADPGAGDGDLIPAQQSIPGLQIVTPFVLGGGIPGSVVNVPAVSTTFYDVTLDITEPLAADGPAYTLFGFYAVQKLVGGKFEIWSTDPSEGLNPDVHNPTLLLAGFVNNATLMGILQSDTGAALSADVVYTSGVIFDAAIDQLNSEGLVGSFSWSVLDIDGPVSVVNDMLEYFIANGTGQFSGVEGPLVPEPTTMALFGGAAWILTMRRKRRTA